MSNENKLEDFHHKSLLKIFKNVTTSYKYLFLKSLLYKLKEDNFDTNEFSINTLSNVMLAHAWYPIKYFKLSFGSQDQIKNIVDEISIPIRTKNNFLRILNSIEEQTGNKELPDILKYVPYRLLTTFYEKELRGIQDSKRNNAIYDISNIKFNDNKPIYRFINHNKIFIHPKWIKYFKNNYGIVEAWLAWEWLSYLQKNNPNVPSLSQKLSPINERRSLTKERDIWANFIKNNKVKCIYSNKILSSDDFVIDHYLPWSFVAHNQAWNLIPVSKIDNANKSDNLPSRETMCKFIDLQFIFLSTLLQNPEKKVYLKYLKSYEFDLNISKEILCDHKSFTLSYSKVLNPLLEQAKNMGFNTYKN